MKILHSLHQVMFRTNSIFKLTNLSLILLGMGLSSLAMADNTYNPNLDDSTTSYDSTFDNQNQFTKVPTQTTPTTQATQATQVTQVTNDQRPKHSSRDVSTSIGLGYKYYYDQSAQNMFGGFLLEYGLVDLNYYFPAYDDSYAFTTGLQINLESYGSSFRDDGYNYDDNNHNYNGGFNFKPVITFGVSAHAPKTGKVELLFGVGGGWGYYSNFTGYNESASFYTDGFYVNYSRSLKLYLDLNHSFFTAQASLGYRIGNISFGMKYILEKEHIYSGTITTWVNDNHNSQKYNLDKTYYSSGVVVQFSLFN